MLLAEELTVSQVGPTLVKEVWAVTVAITVNLDLTNARVITCLSLELDLKLVPRIIPELLEV
jgi:hypothetical protein